MITSRRRWIQALLASVVFPLKSAIAQSYPSKPVRLIVPYGAGTATDALARAIASGLARMWSVNVYVENIPGAGGVIGTQAIQRAEADGNTLGMVAIGHVMNSALYPKLPFDPIKDFAPIMNLAFTPVVVVASAGEHDSLQSLISQAKAAPGKINYGSTGNGSLPHLEMEYLRHLANIQITHVPYRATGPLMTDLLSGRVTVAALAAASALPHINTGKLRPLGVTTASRSRFFPSVPAIAEILPGYEVTPWIGLIAPKGTPAQLIDRLYSDVSAIMHSGEVDALLSTTGMERSVLKADEFWRRAELELPKWSRIVQASGAKID